MQAPPDVLDQLGTGRHAGAGTLARSRSTAVAPRAGVIVIWRRRAGSDGAPSRANTSHLSRTARRASLASSIAKVEPRQRLRTLFGVMFQDGALFGSMSLYDNTAFPLREHTKKKESEIRNVVMEKLDLVGLGGDENKFPGEISGGMRKRAGLARSLVLDPQIILCDEPDSGLDPVRTAYLSQLLIDINAQIDCTILIVTHNINIARTVPDNMGMLFRKHLVMFGPREVLLTSDEPVVKQFLNGRRIGPIGMSEEKDESTMAEEQAMFDAGHHDGGVEEIEGVPRRSRRRQVCPNVRPSAVVRRGCARSCTRCRLPPRRPSATISRAPTSTTRVHSPKHVDARHRQNDYDAPTGVIPTVDSPTVETRTVER